MHYLVKSLKAVRTLFKDRETNPVAIAAGGYLRDTFILGVTAKDLDIFVPGGYWSPNVHEHLMNMEHPDYHIYLHWLSAESKHKLGINTGPFGDLEAAADDGSEYQLLYAKAIYHLIPKGTQGNAVSLDPQVELIFSDEIEHYLAEGMTSTNAAANLLARFDTNLNQQAAIIGPDNNDVNIVLRCPERGEVVNDEVFYGERINKFENQCHQLDVVQGRRAVPDKRPLNLPNTDIPFK